jgi:hypothetical protein
VKKNLLCKNWVFVLSDSGESAARTKASIVKNRGLKILAFGLGLFFCTSSYALSTSDPCTPEKLDEFRAAAQTQSEKTESLYNNIKDCGQMRSEVLIWMSYYDRTTGGNASRLLENDHESDDALSERDQLIAKANRNQYQPLEEEVAKENGPYHSDAEAILSLARAQTRGSEFAKSRENYKTYLKLKPDDTEIEVELAYTYLWAGDQKNAEMSLKELEANAKNPEQSRAAREGLKRLRFAGPQSAADLLSRIEHFGVGFEHYNNNFFNFSRNSTLLEYANKGWVLAGASHFMNSSNYNSASGGELTGSKTFTLTPSVAAYVKLGAFTAGKGAVILTNLYLKKDLKAGLGLGVGFYNEALAHDVPLPTNGLDWTRSAFYGRLAFKQWLEYRIEFRTLGPTDFGTTSTDHQIRFNIPLKANEEGMRPFELYILVENEAFGKQSAYVYSPLSYTAIKGGVQYQDQLSEEVDIKFNFEYGPFYESSRNTKTLTYGSSANLLGVGGVLAYRLDSDLFANFKVRFDRTQSGDAGTTYAATLFGINLVWLLGDGT